MKKRHLADKLADAGKWVESLQMKRHLADKLADAGKWVESQLMNCRFI